MKIDTAKIVVTGGAGFVGSNIVKYLLKHSTSTIVVIDDLFTGNVDSLPQSDRIEFIEGSVADRDTVYAGLMGADIVFHLAARNIIVSTKNPREDYEVNIGGTLNILQASLEYKVRRVVYSSSASVYGNSKYLPVNEDDSTNMLSPYAVSKYAGESYCKAFYESYGLSTCSVRYSNVYGVGQRPDNPYCGVISKFFELAMQELPIKVHGDGEQTRDFTYINDVVLATIAAGFSPKAEGQVYNVGTGRETTINNLAKLVVLICQSNSHVEHIDRRDIDNIRRRVVNIEKIRRELRWSPMFTLEEGLRETYKWLLKVYGR
jgi:UDP-glucose 4-epimerase